MKDAILLHLQSHACVFSTHLDGLDGNLTTEVGTKLCGSAGPELYSNEEVSSQIQICLKP